MTARPRTKERGAADIFDIFRTDDYFTTNHLSSSDAEFPVIDAENRFKKYEYLGD